jgi:SAM-dependent methyltransferase
MTSPGPESQPSNPEIGNALASQCIKQIELCDLCDSRGPFWTLAQEDSLHNDALAKLGLVAERYTTVLCTACGWVSKPGILTDQQVDALYRKSGGNNTHRVEISVAAARSRKVFDLVARFVNTARDLRVLDVGGGVGQASLSFAENGHHVEIVDIAETSPLHPAMQVHSSTLDCFPGSESFDLVLLSHVLEHVWSPTKLLTQTWQMARPGGHVYVEVPFELYTPCIKRKLGDPCHVGYFALHTLGMFLEKVGLTPLLLERGLGDYNTRRVMVLRALAIRAKEARKLDSPRLIPGGMRTLAEMMHPAQMAYAITSKMNRIRSLITS